MFTVPYQTTVCANHPLAQVERGVRLAKIEGNTQTAITSSGKKFPGIELLKPSADSVPPFTQPLDVDGVWYVDARANLTMDREGNVRVSSPNELDFLICRAAISMQWAKGDTGGLYVFQDFPLRVYSKFLGDAVTRRLGLDPLEQIKLNVVAAFFYLTQFEKEIKLDERTKTNYAVRISRALHAPADKVLPILDMISEKQETVTSSTLDDFCSYAKDILTSARSTQINAPLIITSISGAWYGANSRETVAVALEYPPFFNALIYSAITDRSYHSSYFAKLVAQNDRNNAALNYQRALVDYLHVAEA